MTPTYLTALRFLDYVGIGLFALSGALVAALKRQDFVTFVFSLWSQALEAGRCATSSSVRQSGACSKTAMPRFRREPPRRVRRSPLFGRSAAAGTLPGSRPRLCRSRAVRSRDEDGLRLA
jgi:hypothetical protein